MPLTFANTFNKHALLCTLTLRCCEKLKGSHEEMLGQHCDALLAACCGCDQRALPITTLTSLLNCGVLAYQRK